MTTMVKRKVQLGPVPAEHLVQDHPDLFGDMSTRFLDWNQGAVVRRLYRDGEVICTQGEYGSTAFVIELGTVEVRLQTGAKAEQRKPGIVARLMGWGNQQEHKQQTRTSSNQIINLTDVPINLQYGNPIKTMNSEDRIFGEMACMNNYPRSATITARGNVVVLELLRNIVYMMRRTKRSSTTLANLYRERVLETHLQQVPFFQPIFKNPAINSQQLLEKLRHKVDLVRCYPGKSIVREGDTADAFYMVRTGYVKVTQGDYVLDYLGPGKYFGELGLLSEMPELAAYKLTAGKRSATCTALDHVDLVRIRKDDFLEILADYPELNAELIQVAKSRLDANQKQKQDFLSPGIGPFLDQGLYNAQSLLVLDLEKCTRCDECSKACADAHPEDRDFQQTPITRLIREGARFDKYLIASACRSCYDPSCMVGCPVGSIYRKVGKEVVIEDWCIGCGKCAENCPYGNINLHLINDNEEKLKYQAFTCDLCTNLSDGQPSCVYACPHDAAHRMDGPKLWQIVNPASPKHTSSH